MPEAPIGKVFDLLAALVLESGAATWQQEYELRRK